MSKKPEIKYTYELRPRRGRQKTSQQEYQLAKEEYQLEEKAYAAMEEHRNSNQGDDGADRFKTKLDTLVTLRTQLVQHQQKGQRQSSRSPIHGDASHQGEISFQQRDLGSPSYSQTTIPKLSKPMFIKKESGENMQGNLDELFAQYQEKEEKFRAAVSFDKYLKIIGKQVYEKRPHDKKLQQK